MLYNQIPIISMTELCRHICTISIYYFEFLFWHSDYLKHSQVYQLFIVFRLFHFLVETMEMGGISYLKKVYIVVIATMFV